MTLAFKMDLENGFDQIMLVMLLAPQKTEESKENFSTTVRSRRKMLSKS